MNARERFLRTMHFQDVDRVPNRWMGAWQATLERWRREGMTDADLAGLLNLDPVPGVSINLRMMPPFEGRLVEETEEYRIIIDSEGVKKKEFKGNRSFAVDYREPYMPQFLSFPVKNRQDFLQMKKRYDANAKRYPENWEELKKSWASRDYPLGIYEVCSLFGGIRRWMGLEQTLYTFYDNPKLIHEMMEFLTNFSLQVIEKTVKEVDLDFATFWEDMAYNTASLISPKHFREFMVPNYKKITELLRKYGIDIIDVDCDGYVGELIPLWLESGINCVHPMEAAAGNDILAYRKEYGKDLLMMGGIDKRVLAQDKKAIENELTKKLPPLLEEGGYIPTIDHLVPPDVPYENYVYYEELKQRLCEGKSITGNHRKGGYR